MEKWLRALWVNMVENQFVRNKDNICVVSCCVSDFGVWWDGMTRNADDLDLMHSQ